MDNQNNNIGNWFVDQLNLYQSANSDRESIKRNFIIRKSEFEIIINSLKNKKDNDPLQHELILGRRGSGKSTLLKRIQIEIEEKSVYNKKYISINLAEEQAGIYRLFDLWMEVINELKILNTDIALEDYEIFGSDKDYTRYLYQVIHDFCVRKKKKIILLLDNFDRIVENFIDDGNLLREILTNYNDIQIIAGSTRMDEHFWRYDKPFYEFFRRHRLEALRPEEIHHLINHWSNSLNIPQLKDFVKNNPGKIENIRILTDGLPRTLQFFIQILLQNSQLYGYDYLKKVMDNVTPLSQERLNNLTPQLRKIIAEMAFIWEACTTKQLVEKCRMESKLVSANLKTLSNKGIVEKIQTKNKNHYYRISERFFNMWLIITQGNPEQKRKAKWLSIFLENWYDDCDFKKLADDHIDNLKNKRIGFDRALIFSKALSQSKHISLVARDKIIEFTEELDGYSHQDVLLELPRKYKLILKELRQLLDNKDYHKALSLVMSIENEEDGVKFAALGKIYSELEDYKSCEANYLKAITKGNVPAMNNLGTYYKKRNDYAKAEKYYKMAVAKGEARSMFNLGSLYESMNKIYKAKKLYLSAIEKGNVDAHNNLGLLYKDQGKFSEAEKHYQIAIEKGNVKAVNNIAILYYLQNVNKVKALEYITKRNEIDRSKTSTQPQIIIEIWNGIFRNLEKRILENFEENEFIGLELMISHLLIQGQKNLMLKLFRNEKYGKELRERYIVWYYVVLILNNEESDNLNYKIPPELQETINEMLEMVLQKQQFYGDVQVQKFVNSEIVNSEKP